MNSYMKFLILLSRGLTSFWLGIRPNMVELSQSILAQTWYGRAIFHSIMREFSWYSCGRIWNWLVFLATYLSVLDRAIWLIAWWNLTEQWHALSRVPSKLIVKLIMFIGHLISKTVQWHTVLGWTQTKKLTTQISRVIWRKEERQNIPNGKWYHRDHTRKWRRFEHQTRQLRPSFPLWASHSSLSDILEW